MLFAIATYSASFIGGISTINSKEPWYSSLNKSFLTPPDWIFAPVWTTLYLMMTLAIWFYWHSKNRDMNTVYIYFIHIIVNTTWSIVFFALHKIFLAMLVLITLIIFIFLLIIRFKSVNKLSYYLMIPYLLWCFYALFLNINLVILN